ncbi:MAG: hypothetical protein KGI06_05975 [Candidatus Micrarchaeota archaeon]|nr:hypothetical protein [Candidatus Micrarchaeota archaeon]
MFSIKASKKVEKSIDKMPDFHKKGIKEVIIALAEEPVPAAAYDVRKLSGGEDSYRIRIGGIRISYTVL